LYAHTNANRDTYSDSNSYTYFDTETFTDAESYANAQVGTCSGTSSLVLSTPCTIFSLRADV